MKHFHFLKVLNVRLLVLLFSLLMLSKANATIHPVIVSNYYFSPFSFDAVVGDTVLWVWDKGMHTTTATDNIPAGAQSWDAPIDEGDTTFQYVITVAGDYTYYCKFHPDMVGTFSASGSLPVKLSDFSVTPLKDLMALITWTTTSEENASYFSLEKSVDAVQFKSIAKINAVGNSSVSRTYSYIDNIDTKNEKLYYRLAITDKDGKVNLSDIITLNSIIDDGKLISYFGPNPVSNPCKLNIQFKADINGKMLVFVYNLSGSLIKQTEIEATVGLNDKVLLLGNLSAGIYKVVCKLNNRSETKTILVQ